MHFLQELPVRELCIPAAQRLRRIEVLAGRTADDADVPRANAFDKRGRDLVDVVNDLCRWLSLGAGTCADQVITAGVVSAIAGEGARLPCLAGTSHLELLRSKWSGLSV